MSKRENLQERAVPGGMEIEKLVHMALPVRLTHSAEGERGALEMACTYDVHPRGARLLSSRKVRVGDLITVERGRSKAVCQVVWSADPNSALRGQFTVECVDGGRSPWEEDLRQMQERYLPINPKQAKTRPVNHDRKPGENRRRSPRFEVKGNASLGELRGKSRFEGRLEQISEQGCIVQMDHLLAAGTELKLALNLFDVSVAFKASVKYAAANRAIGVEFSAIRQGDRPLLNYMLSQVGKKRPEEFADLEVITEIETAVVG